MSKNSNKSRIEALEGWLEARKVKRVNKKKPSRLETYNSK
jgi:hypothetical protein